MNDLLEKAVAELNLDRSDWKLVKFGDVAIQQKKTVDRENTELTRYVKGEHMYSEDIHLREWGELTDEYLGPAFIRKFEEGDILYGSRRTYLRKVVVAPFDGITSNTTFVIKANEDLIDKRLLPFIMLSEGFTQHSIKNSKGSVNPYINWKDLASYELLLPPSSKQRELSELLLLGDSSLELKNDCFKTLEVYFNAKLAEHIKGFSLGSSKGQLPDGWSLKKLKDIAKFIDYRGKTPKKTEHGIKLITAKNVRKGWIDPNPEEFISEEDYEPWMRRGIPKIGDVLFTTEAPLGNVAIVKSSDKFALAQRIICLQPVESVSGTYLSFVLSHPEFINKIQGKSSGTTVSGIRSAYLKEIMVPIPPYEIQNEINLCLSEISSNLDLFKENKKVIKNLIKSIINQVF